MSKISVLIPAYKYAGRDPRIRVINPSENCGVMSARKASVEASEGDYLMFR